MQAISNRADRVFCTPCMPMFSGFCAWCMCMQRPGRPADHHVRVRHAGGRQRKDMGPSLEPLLEPQRTDGEIQAAESADADTTCLAYTQVRFTLNTCIPHLHTRSGIRHVQHVPPNRAPLEAPRATECRTVATFSGLWPWSLFRAGFSWWGPGAQP